jgi:hypothetical protein
MIFLGRIKQGKLKRYCMQVEMIAAATELRSPGRGAVFKYGHLTKLFGDALAEVEGISHERSPAIVVKVSQTKMMCTT